jgi:hypothetical protein
MGEIADFVIQSLPNATAISYVYLRSTEYSPNIFCQQIVSFFSLPNLYSLLIIYQLASYKLLYLNYRSIKVKDLFLQMTQQLVLSRLKLKLGYDYLSIFVLEYMLCILYWVRQEETFIYQTWDATCK